MKPLHRILFFVYALSFAGLAFRFSRPYFAEISALFVVAMFGLLMYTQESAFRAKYFFVSFFIIIVGFMVEVVGVKTGRVFGSYYFGNGLGPKMFDTPFVIGLNWFLLAYCTNSIVSKAKLKTYQKVLIGASLMTLFDIPLELAAPYMDLWHRLSESIPLMNYMGVFGVSLFFHAVMRIFHFHPHNRLARTVFFAQTFFFAIVWLYFRFFSTVQGV